MPTLFTANNEEPCLLKIQQMLIDDYVAYLKLIGLAVINIVKPHKYYLIFCYLLFKTLSKAS